MKNVAFVFFQDFTGQPEQFSLIKRLEMYSLELNRSQGKVLTVYFFRGSNEGVKLMSSSTLKIKIFDLRGLHIIGAVILLFRQSKDTKFIAGNLWRDFPILLIIKTLKLGKAWIQISIHGELFSQDSKVSTQFAKQIIANCFRFSDSVRFVSANLADHVSSRFAIKQNRVVISPIPTLITIQNENVVSEKALCYLGRIHHERDYKLWSEIAKLLNAKVPDTKFLIIGSGLEAKAFSELLLSEIPAHKINFRGYLTQVQLTQEFRNFHILLSTAPEEGYGLAIREVGLQNKYVVARKNSGTIPLALSYPKTYLLFESPVEAVELIRSIWDEEKDLSEIKKITDDLTRSNQISLNSLISSWS